jgi:hypothetical protein
MDATTVIEIMGGRAEVRRITGLTTGRLSQWVKENHIPISWMTAFRAMKPREFRQAEMAAVSRRREMANV